MARAKASAHRSRPGPERSGDGVVVAPNQLSVAASFTAVAAASIAATPVVSAATAVPLPHELPVPKLPPLGNLIQRKGPSIPIHSRSD